MSLLSIIQNCSTAIGLIHPNSVIGNTEQYVRELLLFAQLEGKWLAKRHDFQILRGEQTFTSVAAETQTSAVPTDFLRFINETFWNRTQRKPMVGPLSAQEWSNTKATIVTPTDYCFRYTGGNILITPTPTAGHTIAYEYIKKNWCQSSGGTAQAAWTADTDTGIINETCIELGTIVRYKMSKGLPYDEDMAQYEAFILSEIMGDEPRGRVDLSGEKRGRVPGITVPESNWNVT